jgi:hypothetical protein
MRTWLPDQVYESEVRAVEVLRYLIEEIPRPGHADSLTVGQVTLPEVPVAITDEADGKR